MTKVLDTLTGFFLGVLLIGIALILMVGCGAIVLK